MVMLFKYSRRSLSLDPKSRVISSYVTMLPHKKSMPPFIPPIFEESPEFLTHPLHSKACMRLCRMDLPAPGPPQNSEKKETS